MIAMLVALACAAAGGLWLVATAVWPSTPSLAASLARMSAPARRLPSGTPLGGSVDAAAPTASVRVGRWLLRRMRSSSLLVDERTAADLELLRRPAEVYAGSVALSAVGWSLIGPIGWGVAALGGVSLPVIAPAWFLVAGAVAGWFLPRALLRSEAARAREDFRHALGAYLDLLVLLLAAQEGPESAMDLAAGAGEGPAFAELRRAVTHARLSGEPVWDSLDDLGWRLSIVELREIAAAGALAGESGAAVRKSLTAKARSLRASALAAAEATARRQSQAMFGPLVMMGMGFILFLVYPLLTNMTIGGP